MEALHMQTEHFWPFASGGGGGGGSVLLGQ